MIVFLLLGLALLSGCAHYSCSVSGGSAGRRGGTYHIAQCLSPALQRELVALNDGRQTFLDMPRGDAVDLRISIVGPRKTSMGGLKVLNNICSGLTLGIIPWRDDDQASLKIKVESDFFRRELEIEASSCLEVGHLPLPLLGIGDILYFTGGTVVGTVMSACTSKPDYLLAGFGLLIERNGKKKEQTAKSYLAQNIDNAKLARAIASSLSQKDYQNAMRQVEHGKRFLPAGMIADYAEMRRLDRTLRPFALKNSPQLWSQIQEVRAALDVHDEKVNELHENLSRLGVQPKDDKGYVRACNERYQMALLLKKLYGELKNAYREAQLFESTFRKNDYDEINRKTRENGIQDAKMLQDYYRKLNEK